MGSGLDSSDQRLAYGLLRMVVGLNLLMHGVIRISTGPSTFAAKMVAQFEHTLLPTQSVWAFALFLPTVEAFLGLLLLIGLRTRAALIAASLVIMVLTFGSSVVQDWPVAGLQLTYALTYAALLFLLRYNGWSLDAWIHRGKNGEL